MNNQNSIGILLLLLLALSALDGGGPGAGVRGNNTGFGQPPEAAGYAGARGGAWGGPGAWTGDGVGPGGGFPKTVGSLGAAGRPPFRPPHPAALAKDFHRMVGIMGKVDNLGQMALNPPPIPKPPKTSEPESLINASALPDLSGIMDMLGPIMSDLGGSGEK